MAKQPGKFLPSECLIGEKGICRKEPQSLITSHTTAGTAQDFLHQFALPKQMLEQDEKHLFLIKIPLLSHIIVLISWSPQLKSCWTMLRHRLPLRQLNLCFLSSSDQLAHTVFSWDGRKYRIRADSDFQNPETRCISILLNSVSVLKATTFNT